VLQIAFKCCTAMDYAYREQGIVHRDLKPSNIMIAGGTDIKIADFGAAFLKKSQTAQEATMGSPYYMAPEQLRGEEPTFHSDIYSLGVVLYELLAGRRPVHRRQARSADREDHERRTAPPSELRRRCRARSTRWCCAPCGRTPARYGTWAQFAVELSKVIGLVQPPSLVADSEKYLALSKVEMLQLLGDAEFWELAGAARWTRRDKGSIILRENASGSSFYFLAKGEVKVTKKGRLLSMIHEGECFGEMGFIRGGEEPREATVEAVTDVVVAEFQPETLEGLSTARSFTSPRPGAQCRRAPRPCKLTAGTLNIS
jgi:serine/threonine protein kinase